MAFGTSEIILLIFLLIVIIVIWLLLRGRGRQQQQQQQQVVIQGDKEGRKRVCPKCGMQNDKDAKFCSDCGFKFNV